MSEGLVIYAFGVGGGILALCGLPGNDGSYESDMDHIRDWQPGLVVSLTTQIELMVADAQTLGADLQSMGCRWVHMPIEDFSTPDAAFEAAWGEVAGSAHRALAGGGRVLVHCRGGCGRSGMIALKLMVEAGEDADTALSRLRAVRSCAVETDDQLDWARSFVSGSVEMSPTSDPADPTETGPLTSGRS